MQSSNPTLGNQTFVDLPRVKDESEEMTIQGTVIKTAILLLLILLTAGWVWNIYFKSAGQASSVNILTIGGAIGGFVAAIVTTFKKDWATYTAPIYALLQGLFIGGISAAMEAAFPGIVIQAVGLTFGTLAAMLIAYESGLLRATDTFKMVVVSATGGIALFYLASIVLSLFSIQVPLIYGNGMWGILFSLFVVVIAALNFVIDFDFIEQGAQNRVPKYMEWYGAFALMVTLVWLYVEFLRLLSKIRSER